MTQIKKIFVQTRRAFCVSALLGLTISCEPGPELESQSSVDSVSSVFVTKHWLRPLSEQGEPPKSYSALEQSLLPKDCGKCHVSQYEDWQGSLHSKAMGPGLLGQLMDFDSADSSAQQDCLHCHAPLAEQGLALREQLVKLSMGAIKIEDVGKPGGGLHQFGLACASCHMRGYNIFGPPRNPGLPTPDSSQVGSHNYFTEDADFESSEFCGACHQFEQDGNRIAGKLVENTLEEWKASRYAKEGTTCQKCHMPDRRHLFRGIHDPETTRNGVTIIASDLTLDADMIAGALTLTNSNTGHNFPTYLTPKVYLQAFQIDKDGEIVPETFQQEIIGWEANSTLTDEEYDTRLAPDESLTLNYLLQKRPETVDLVLRVMVDPDNFYRGFYEAKLRGGYTNLGTDQIIEAFQASRASFYPLYETVHRIKN